MAREIEPVKARIKLVEYMLSRNLSPYQTGCCKDRNGICNLQRIDACKISKIEIKIWFRIGWADGFEVVSSKVKEGVYCTRQSVHNNEESQENVPFERKRQLKSSRTFGLMRATSGYDEDGRAPSYILNEGNLYNRRPSRPGVLRSQNDNPTWGCQTEREQGEMQEQR